MMQMIMPMRAQKNVRVWNDMGETRIRARSIVPLQWGICLCHYDFGDCSGNGGTQKTYMTIVEFVRRGVMM